MHLLEAPGPEARVPESPVESGVAADARHGERGGDRFVYEEFDPSTDEQLQRDLQVQYGLRPMSMGLFSEGSFYLYGILDVGGQAIALIIAETIFIAGFILIGIGVLA